MNNNMLKITGDFSSEEKQAQDAMAAAVNAVEIIEEQLGVLTAEVWSDEKSEAFRAEANEWLATTKPIVTKAQNDVNTIFQEIKKAFSIYMQQ